MEENTDVIAVSADRLTVGTVLFLRCIERKNEIAKLIVALLISVQHDTLKSQVEKGFFSNKYIYKGRI